jgi:pimeloyl-ACP methyl ester carboxylesterase
VSETFSPTPAEVGGEKKTYSLESGHRVEVDSKIFHPSPEVKARSENLPHDPVVFLPGWAMQAGFKSMEKISQSFADYSRRETFTVTSRVDESSANSLEEEAQAIAKFIKEKGLTRFSLAGHSQGGDKAILIAAILKNDPDIKIDGLILFDSVGLYDQGDLDLVAKFTSGSLLGTPKGIIQELFTQSSAKKRGSSFAPDAIQSGKDLLQGMGAEIKRSKLSYPKRIRDEVQQMADLNTKTAEVNVPVILISGTADTVSEPGQILAQGDQPGEGWQEITDREKVLQEKYFRSSPYVRMVVPEKLGHHGLPLFRSDSAARASLYLIERSKRPH